jgi:NADPH-dependent ferric siderophore reductase
VRSLVRAVARLSPGFVRVTVGGPQLRRFAAEGVDQRVKVVVPGPGAAALGGPEPVPLAEWQARWRAGAERPALRTYTVAAARPDELDLDFFVHADPGPASAWALRAEVGEELLLSGSAAPGRFCVQWSPGAARRVLVAGDEAAVPAIRAIVREAAVEPVVVVAAADPADVLVPGAAHVDSLVAALDREWAVDAGIDYAWVAAETAQVAEIRRLLAGIPVVQAQGYWTTTPR